MKRRSDTKSEPRHKGYTFFADRDLSPHGNTDVAKILKAAGLSVEFHDDHFAKDAADHEWLAECGRNQWIALSKDTRIRYAPLAIEQIMRASVPLFVLIGAHRHEVLAYNLVNTIEQVIECLERNSNGFIARVYRPQEGLYLAGKPGSVKEWITPRNWRPKA